MTDEQKKAWAKRDNTPLASIRRIFDNHVGTFVRAAQTLGDISFVNVLWICLLDNAAVYAIQRGISKNDFLVWADESYDVYTAFLNNCERTEEGVHKLAIKLREEMSKNANTKKL